MLKSEYIAIAVALIALIIAIYALLTQPKYEPPPTASAAFNLVDKVTVNVPGVHTINIGWIHVRDAPAVVELSANYTQIWFLLNGVRYGNPAVATLQPGNYTVGAIIALYGNATKINISYKVLG